MAVLSGWLFLSLIFENMPRFVGIETYLVCVLLLTFFSGFNNPHATTQANERNIITQSENKVRLLTIESLLLTNCQLLLILTFYEQTRSMSCCSMIRKKMGTIHVLDTDHAISIFIP